MSNRLKEQSSPYLLQHSENPVDWYPWCEAAFEKAEKENKPIFLSIGYSTCHWCHVMAHESFENEEIAGILNQYFVSIKVDREERPDIDSVYMSVCQALSGSGGWPMSVFMTAEQKPFFAGTYFPPVSRYGMIGFRDLLLAIAEKWKSDRIELLESAEQILAHIDRSYSSENPMHDSSGASCCSMKDCEWQEQIDSSLLRQAADLFCRSFDAEHGGFGQAPKFPMPHNLLFLTLYARLYPAIEKQIDIHGLYHEYEKKVCNAFEQVKKTLEKMRRGGLFDQIGYGFSRYSTDAYFLVPHFEKMLYDNALLIIAYAAAYKVSDDRMFLDTAEKTAAYVFREMTGEEGAFFSAQDADSEGEEGKFYVWHYEEVCRILGFEKGKQFCEHFGITKEGNFEGRNIPNLLKGTEISDAFEEERKVLYEYRKNRAKLHLDDKILTSWNALMVCALSILYRVTGKNCYLLAAERAQQFIEENLTDKNTLYVSCRNGVRSGKGFLDDYAYETAALLCLYEATEKTAYLRRAEEICKEAIEQFADEAGGGYFLYGIHNDGLITRPKETYDGALPSGNSVMAYCLVRLSQIVQDGEGSRTMDAGRMEDCGGAADYRQAAEKQLAFLSHEAASYPAGCSMFLIALLFYCYPPQKITVVLSPEESKKEEREKRRAAMMARLPLYADIHILFQETEEYRLLNGKTTYYVCKNHTCLPPGNQFNGSEFPV